MATKKRVTKVKKPALNYKRLGFQNIDEAKAHAWLAEQPYDGKAQNRVKAAEAYARTLYPHVFRHTKTGPTKVPWLTHALNAGYVPFTNRVEAYKHTALRVEDYVPIIMHEQRHAWDSRNEGRIPMLGNYLKEAYKNEFKNLLNFRYHKDRVKLAAMSIFNPHGVEGAAMEIFDDRIRRPNKKRWELDRVYTSNPYEGQAAEWEREARLRFEKGQTAIGRISPTTRKKLATQFRVPKAEKRDLFSNMFKPADNTPENRRKAVQGTAIFAGVVGYKAYQKYKLIKELLDSPAARSGWEGFKKKAEGFAKKAGKGKKPPRSGMSLPGPKK